MVAHASVETARVEFKSGVHRPFSIFHSNKYAVLSNGKKPGPLLHGPNILSFFLFWSSNSQFAEAFLCTGPYVLISAATQAAASPYSRAGGSMHWCRPVLTAGTLMVLFALAPAVLGLVSPFLDEA